MRQMFVARASDAIGPPPPPPLAPPPPFYSTSTPSPPTTHARAHPISHTRHHLRRGRHFVVQLACPPHRAQGQRAAIRDDGDRLCHRRRGAGGRRPVARPRAPAVADPGIPGAGDLWTVL